MKYYLGIDPGLGGALALIDDRGRFCELVDLPVKLKYTKEGKTKRCINALVLEQILSAFIAEYGEIQSMLEDVHGRAGWNAAVVFSLGESLGTIRAVLDILTIPIVLVTPIIWKKYFKLGSDKELAREYAIKRFPHAKDLLNRKKDHDRAEALLIAAYNFEFHRGV